MRARTIAVVCALVFGALCIPALWILQASQIDARLQTEDAEAMLRNIFAQRPAQEEAARGGDWLGNSLIWRRFEPRLAATATVYWLRRPRVPLCGKAPFPYATAEGLSDARFVTTRTSPVTARVRIDFKHYGQTANVTYDLAATKAGWRIHDIAWRDGISIHGHPPDMTARQFLSVFTWTWPLLECEVA